MATSFRYGFDNLPELLKQQSKNGLALETRRAQTLGVVIEGGAGRAPFERTTGSMIYLVSGQLHGQREVARNIGEVVLTLSQGSLEILIKPILHPAGQEW